MRVKPRDAVTGAKRVYLNECASGPMPARDGRTYPRLRRPAAATDTAAAGVKRSAALGGAACQEAR